MHLPRSRHASRIIAGNVRRLTPTRVVHATGGAPSAGDSFSGWWMEVEVCRGSVRHRPPADIPDETRKLAGNGDDHDVGMLAGLGQPTEAFAQAQLRIPGAIDDVLGQSFVAELNDAADLRGVAVAPRRFDQQAPGVAVAGLGDAALALLAAAAVLAGHDAQPAHQLARIVEAREVADLGDQAQGDGELHPAQRLQGLDGGIEAPGRCRLAQHRFQTLALRQPVLDRAPVLLEGQLRADLRKGELRQPAPMRVTPVGVAGVTHAMHEQERLQPLLGLARIGLGAAPGPDQIAKGLRRPRPAHARTTDLPTETA
jgi:hypothetical protein